ncbi:hypothetical protein KC19_4G120400 [Ceratodon purpureus]|uniref:Uncharacterized protein n=1 Tax=Ceratodon purpureus TaxID=3225 RepID=A0A8T0IAC3_CERPU|nr:hypothetical protein KC19_4G120400 [Ceratodon purpureus]
MLRRSTPCWGFVSTVLLETCSLDLSALEWFCSCLSSWWGWLSVLHAEVHLLRIGNVVGFSGF